MDLAPLLDALRCARPRGHAIDEWSVYGHASRGLSLGIKDREVGNPHAPLKLGETCGARYRLIWDDGMISRGYLERRLLENEAVEALDSARDAAYDDPDAAHVAGPAEFPDVDLHDERSAAMAGGDAGPLAPRLDAVRRIVDERAFGTWSGSFSSTLGRSRIVASSGLDATSEGTAFGWHVTFNGEIGDGFGSRAPEDDGEFAARLERLADVAELLARPAEPPTAGTRPVLLHPRVVESYVIGTLLSNLSGSTVANGEGHFRREQFGSGEVVMREDLGLRIDPLIPLRNGSYRFTTEGIPAAPCAFVEGGRLVQPVCDMKYARRLGRPPTSLPADSDTMFLEGPERWPLDRALDRAAGGALVLSVLGVHTQDSASGDFSLSAPQSLVIGDAGPTGRMRATIAGNVFEVLSSAALRFVDFEGEHLPGLLFDCRLDPR